MRAAVHLVLLVACDVSSAVAATSAFKDERIGVELLAEHASLQPGSQSWVGIKLDHARHWHTYWMNPGDSGLPTRLEWTLPNGFRAGDIAWPAPKRIELGGVFNFGYEDTVLLPVPIDVPGNAKPGTPITIAVNARWVVCNDDQCIPGKTTLQLTLPVSAVAPAADPKSASLFANARARQPIATVWRGQTTVNGNRVRIELRGQNLPNAVGLDAFPTAPKLLNNTPLKISRTADRMILDAERSDYFESAPATLGLVLTQAGKSWRVDVPWATGNSTGTLSVN